MGDRASLIWDGEWDEVVMGGAAQEEIQRWGSPRWDHERVGGEPNRRSGRGRRRAEAKPNAAAASRVSNVTRNEVGRPPRWQSWTASRAHRTRRKLENRTQ